MRQFGSKAHAKKSNSLGLFPNLELFGVIERAEGRASAEAANRAFRQYALDTISRPMHVVLEIREKDARVLMFRNVCGKSFTTYEGAWELTTTGSGTRVIYRLKADPTSRQPAMLAPVWDQGQRQDAAREVRQEILARAAR